MSQLKISTGYFGVPGTERCTNVHVYNGVTGRCLCGYLPNDQYQFQWCAHGVQMDYVECKSCKIKGEQLVNLVGENHGKEK